MIVHIDSQDRSFSSSTVQFEEMTVGLAQDRPLWTKINCIEKVLHGSSGVLDIFNISSDLVLLIYKI